MIDWNQATHITIDTKALTVSILTAQNYHLAVSRYQSLSECYEVASKALKKIQEIKKTKSKQ